MLNNWDIFTAKHEYNVNVLDKFNRVSSKQAPFDVLTPSVSTYLLRNGFNPKYPDGKEFAVCISHDVDWMFNNPYSLNYFLRKSALSLLKGDFKQIKQYRKELKRHIPYYYNLESTLAFNKKYNFNSSFYFLSLGPGDEDYRYEVSEIKNQFDKVHVSGNEIGLHGGHLAYNNAAKLLSEKERLEKAASQKIIGYRNHYLRFDIKNTWEILQKNGFNYDTTFGFADSVGFRNGMCHPFVPFNIQTRSYYSIKEIPLMVMDTTLYKYLSLDNDKSLPLIEQLVNTIKEHRGVLSILWHNDSMVGKKGELFESILDQLSTKNCWFATGAQLIDWYEKNGYFEEIASILNPLREEN